MGSVIGSISLERRAVHGGPGCTSGVLFSENKGNDLRVVFEDETLHDIPKELEEIVQIRTNGRTRGGVGLESVTTLAIHKVSERTFNIKDDMYSEGLVLGEERAVGLWGKLGGQL
jgi:hypothetical protein